jgi:hypothetical protein
MIMTSVLGSGRLEQESSGKNATKVKAAKSV